MFQRLDRGVAEPLLLGGRLGAALLVGPHLTRQLLPQQIAVFLQMEQPLQHRPAVRSFQRQKFSEFTLGQHNCAGEIVHLKAKLLLHTTRDVGELVGDDLFPFG
ncbi:hypothetical protein D3C76_1165580 [compost metagenome]